MSAPLNLRATLRALVLPAERVLLVGVRGFGQPVTSEVATLAELPEEAERFDAIVWLVRAGLDGAFARLRRLLRPSGRLVVWVEPTGMAAQVWSALSRAPARTSVALEDVCEALVLAGLLTPRVIGRGPRGFAVCGTMPAHPDTLDALFEQPAP
jgi:hypothetical protein